MNLRLLIDLLISNFNAKKFPNLRSSLSLPHGFCEKNNVDKLKENFTNHLKKNSIKSSGIF